VVPGGVTGPITVVLRPHLEGDVGPVEPAGIGAVLVPEGDGLAIGALRGEAGGLAPGDEVLEVDGQSVAELGLGGAVEELRGAEGTSAFLVVRRGNTTLDVEVPRRRQR
jgi:C-terminal processing protease CtpA/Prc